MIAIVAMSLNRAIGLEGRIPWHLPADLQFFKRTTLGHVVLMGRKTYESIGKPLPGRENWVLSRSADIPGVRVLRSLDEIPPPPHGKNLYLIGGAELYSSLLPQCSQVIITKVNRTVNGDTFFPPYDAFFDEGKLLHKDDHFEIHLHHRLSPLIAPPQLSE